jgi:hypothetical protein
MSELSHVPDPALTLNSLLKASGIPSEQMIVFRHRPYEAELNRVFDNVAGERSDLFDCYQSTHSARTEAALTRTKHVASFIRYTAGTAVFVGLYEVNGWREISVEECIARPSHIELMSLGMVGINSKDGRSTLLEFDLKRTDWLSGWRGRLIIRWPGLERSWYRWADRNEFGVEAIALQSVLTKPMPAWDEVVLRWTELAVLPDSWRAALRQWRGVYLIVDRSDGKQYVGSAYGAQNILQRWLEYSRTGHGGNKLLRKRDAHHFLFSILQRVGPDLDDANVVAVEKKWKDRLNTRAPAGLNEN